MPRRGCRGHLATPVCAVALLAGCTAGTPPDIAPAPAASGSIGAEISAEAVADVLPNDLEAETYWAMDRSTWQQLRQDAMSLPWHMVSAAGVEQAAACIGQGAPTVVYVDGFRPPAAPHWSQAAAEQSESNRVYWEDTWNDLQRQAATISDNSLHAIVDESDHAIPIRNPGAVVAATTAVAASIRAGNTDLPSCPDDLAAAGVTCTGP